MKYVKYNLLILLLFGVKGFAQLNIPAHFAYIKEGVYKEYSRDSSTVNEKKIEAFYMYRFEVSGLDYQRYLKATNKKLPADLDSKRPIVNVNYEEAQAYCSWLKSIYKVNFSLPTKEQWEYAARGGNFDTNDYIYNKALPNDYIVYIGNAPYEKAKCTSCMRPNEFGLYGMVGNVWEWTEQQLKGWNTFIVGGSYFEDADHVKAITKKSVPMGHRQKDIGFRMVVEAKEFQKLINK